MNMMTTKNLLQTGVLALSLLATSVMAAVSADEAAKLGTTLTPLGAEKAGNGLVQRPVAAAADHQINIFALLPGDGGGVSPSQRHVGDDLIARLCKCQQNVSQMPVRPFHPGKWIHDKQHLFHVDNLDYPVVFLFVYYTIPGKMRKSFSLPLVNSG